MARRNYEGRDKSIFGSVTAPKTKSFNLPKPNGAKSFEVVGIPLKDPGFYVVEIESEILGASLLGISKPMFVPTTVWSPTYRSISNGGSSPPWPGSRLWIKRYP